MPLPAARRGFEKLLFGAGLLGLFAVASSRVRAWDLFWQLRSGAYMLAERGFIRRDTFSLAADAPRWEHCWLHDILVYAAYLLGGYAGISLLKGGLVAATALTLAAAARRSGGSWGTLLLLGLPAVLFTFDGWLARPQLWSFLLFALFLLLLEDFRQSGSRRIYLLIPLLVLWVNLHAGVILAFAVVAAYLVGDGAALLLGRLDLSARTWRRLPVAAAALLPAALANPYGLAPLRALFSQGNLGAGSGMDALVYNYDWQPTTYAAMPAFYWAMGLALLLLLARWRRLPLAHLLLLAGLAFMGLKLKRHVPLFFFAAAAILPPYLDAALAPLQRWCGSFGRGAMRVILVVAALTAVGWTGYPLYRRDGFFDVGLHPWQYPVKAAEFVRAQRLPGNLFNSYTYGGYLMWALYPEYRVFFDGRQDDPALFRKGLQVSYGIIGWDRVLDEYQVNTVVTAACTVFPSERYPLVDRLVADQRWALVFSDEISLVFVRKAAADPAWLTRLELPRSRAYETVLSAATLLAEENPARYNAYWEMAQVYMDQRKFPEAFAALRAYLSLAPKPNPAAENYYRQMLPIFGQQS